MSDFLSSVLAATESRLSGAPVIVSEQHDTSAINWLNGMSDPGEMLACGYLPQLRREIGETDDAYAARIMPLLNALPQGERDKIMSGMMRAAQNRAALDTSNGRVSVMVAGAPAWHRLGVNVANAVNSRHAIELAGQNWHVQKTELRYTDDTGTLRTADGAFGLYRHDTGAFLGGVGSRYNPIQNAEGYEFLDGVMGAFGARYHTAGAVRGGKAVWMQVELPNQSFRVTEHDEQQAFATFFNPHDGSGAAVCFPTMNRIVCNNTLRRALGADEASGLRIRHTGSVKAKIADAQNALGLAVKGFAEYKEEAAALVRTPMNAGQLDTYLAGVLDSVLDITSAQLAIGAAGLAQGDVLAGIISGQEARDAAEKRYQRAINDRSKILDDIKTRHASERCAIDGQRGTAWAALQAVTEHADHGKRREVGSEHDRDSRRFESVLSGDRDELKQVAFRAALALAS